MLSINAIDLYLTGTCVLSADSMESLEIPDDRETWYVVLSSVSSSLEGFLGFFGFGGGCGGLCCSCNSNTDKIAISGCRMIVINK